MAQTYSYSIPVNDLQQLYTYLTTNMSLVKSVTAGSMPPGEQYNSNIAITVYTDSVLSTDNENTLTTLINNYTNPMPEVIVNAFRKISVINSTAIPLYPSAIFTGQWEDVSNYSTITVFVSSDQNSATDGFEMHYSTDAVNSDFTKYLSVDNTGSRNQLTVTSRYFKVVYTNGNLTSNVRIQSMYHHYRNKAIGTNIAQPINDSFDCEVNRSVINGRLQNGTYVPVNANADGEIQVSISSPISSFGELSTAPNTPVLQHDFVYSVNPNFFQSYIQNNATVTNQNGMAVCTTAGLTNSVATIRSRRVLRYKAGQGCLGRFTAIYDPPQNGNYQIVGFGNPESGMFFGYYGTSFGIIYTSANVRELRQLTIISHSSDVQNVTIVLGGVTFEVPVTVGANESVTANDIASFDYTTTYPGWVMSAVGSTVYIGCLQAGANTDDFSISFPISGDAIITQTWGGSNSTTTFIPQTSWNVDMMDGSSSEANPSSVTLNPQNGNLYYIKFQYLGFGYMEFGIEDPISTNSVPVHRILYSNHHQATNLANPTLPFVVSTRNITCSNSISTKCASCVGIIQGAVRHLGTLSSYTQSNTNITNTMTHIFTIRSMFLYKNRFNLVNITPISLNICNFGSSFAEIYIIRYGVLDNNAFFQNTDENSAAEFDISSLTITGGQVKYSSGICPGQNITTQLHDLDIIIEQNTVLSVVAMTLTGTTSISCSLTYAED